MCAELQINIASFLVTYADHCTRRFCVGIVERYIQQLHWPGCGLFDNGGNACGEAQALGLTFSPCRNKKLDTLAADVVKLTWTGLDGGHLPADEAGGRRWEGNECRSSRFIHVRNLHRRDCLGKVCGITQDQFRFRNRIGATSLLMSKSHNRDAAP